MKNAIILQGNDVKLLQSCHDKLGGLLAGMNGDAPRKRRKRRVKAEVAAPAAKATPKKKTGKKYSAAEAGSEL